MAYDRDRPEWPRAEPEIIPPDRSGRGDYGRPPWQGGPFTHSTHRIHVTRLGPFGAVLLLLAVAAVAVMAVVAVLGALLFWIPVVAVALLAGAVFRLLRR